MYVCNVLFVNSEYARHNNLPDDLKNDIITTLHYNTQTESQFDSELLEDMSLSLRKRVSGVIFAGFMNRVTLFQHLSPNFLNEVS